MEYLEKVCSSKTNNINRKGILIPLAEALNINHSLFKNRKLLIEEIQRCCPASKRCENSEDFITLCPIDLNVWVCLDIPHRHGHPQIGTCKKFRDLQAFRMLQQYQ